MSIKEFIQRNPVRIFNIFFLSIIGALGTTGGSYILTFAINYLKKGYFKSFVFISIEFILAMFLGYLCSIFSKYLFAKQTQVYLHSIRSEVIRCNYESYFPSPVYKIQNKLTNDLNILSNDFLSSVLSIFNQILSILFSCVALVSMHWTLLLLVFVLVTIMISIPKLLSKPLQEATLKVSENTKSYLNGMEKWLGGISEIKRYKSFSKLDRVLDTSSLDLEKSSMHRYNIQYSLNLINLVFSIFSQGSVLILSGILILNGIVSFGVIFTASQFASFIFSGVGEISNSYGSIISTKSLNSELQTYMNRPKCGNLIRTNSDDIYEIITEDLSIEYKNGEKLFFPDIHISAGEKILLTGDSGSGKSTLLKLLLGDLKPTQGNIIFKDNHNKIIIPDYSEIGYIPQRATIFPASIEDNITMFNINLRKDLSNTIDLVDLNNDISYFPKGIDTKLDLDNPNYSGGQQQKIILARALIHKKNILFIDEGTSAIDTESTFKILKNLMKCSATVIFIAHNFNYDTKNLFQRCINITKRIL
ncbi:ATP-binding cassette domain-containing protein [Xylocopilactobacillus apicola]|uniref:ABC transporter ATP-binding protein n=1 Tax=Xylocopilactobacillus apicola TaxID=2932184 RepID=A0AAU9D312_9LACO|nr:ABC transporter ATP-binding protein [Xylocopilactobacillus apicola]BDR57853.1 ABC transporter ATP-binding protein [Xylocopilactobacillus apicola]